MWYASALVPYPSSSASGTAPRASACPSSSITSMPAPSPMTKPSRALSNGRDARVGWSLKPVDIVRAAAKAPRLTRSMQASAPPHTATSASPARIRRAASPMACALAAHAVTGAPSGPRKPWRIEMWPAAILARKLGTVNGDSRRGPRPSVVRTASTMAPKPPTPEPTMVAVRSRSLSVSGSQPACCKASCAAASANTLKRSIFFWSFGSTARAGSKPQGYAGARSGTTPATFADIDSVISSGSMTSPDRPSRRRRHAASTPQPSGETIPIPVTTMRRVFKPYSFFGR